MGQETLKMIHSMFSNGRQICSMYHTIDLPTPTDPFSLCAELKKNCFSCRVFANFFLPDLKEEPVRTSDIVTLNSQQIFLGINGDQFIVEISLLGYLGYTLEKWDVQRVARIHRIRKRKGCRSKYGDFPDVFTEIPLLRRYQSLHSFAYFRLSKSSVNFKNTR